MKIYASSTVSKSGVDAFRERLEQSRTYKVHANKPNATEQFRKRAEAGPILPSDKVGKSAPTNKSGKNNLLDILKGGSKTPPEFPPHHNPLFAKRDSWMKRLGSKVRRLLKGVAVVGVGVAALYSFVLYHRMYSRLKYLKKHGEPEAPFVDPVSYVMDGWPRVPIPRKLAELAINRLVKSSQFKKASETLTEKQRASLTERLRQRVEKQKDEQLDKRQLAMKASKLGRLLEHEMENSRATASNQITASDLNFVV